MTNFKVGVYLDMTMRIHEIFDTKAQINWVRNNDMHVGTFTYGSQTFVINIELFFRSLIDNNTYTIVHIGFGLNSGSGTLVMDKTGLNKSDSVKIFGIVSNGIQEELDNYEIDIIVLGSTSEDAEEKASRIKIYDKMATTLGKGRRIERNVVTSGGTYIILFRQDMDDNVMKTFIQNLKLT